MTKKISIFSVLFFASYCLIAQYNETINTLNQLNVANINEQIYTQTNCEVYAPGDTLWFKAYIRNKASLKKSDFSKVLHFCLIDKYGNIIDQEKSLITDSYSKGYLLIRHNLDEGLYKLVCYSSWMQNFKPDLIFQKQILVENDFKKTSTFTPILSKDSYSPGDTVEAIVKFYNYNEKKYIDSKFRYQFKSGDAIIDKGATSCFETNLVPIRFILPDTLSANLVLRITDNINELNFEIKINADLHIDFFPEGGSCISNQLGTIAFKAMYSSGLEASVTGVVVDDEGQEYAAVKTEHNGMGKFIFAPQKDKTYYLKINNPKTAIKYKLPQVKENSWALKAMAINGKIHIEVRNNATKLDTCLITLSIRGYNYFYKLITSEMQGGFVIPTQELPSGVGVITLLNKYNLPLSERLVFVNYEHFVDAGISTAGKQYLCRDSVQLSINLNDSNIDFSKGQYSLAVYDAIFGETSIVENNNIISENLLSPEIKGPILNPNYYFKKNNRVAQYHLDLLLLTQGWRNYTFMQKLPHTDSIILPQSKDVVKGNLERKKFNGSKVPVEGNVLVYFAGTSNRINTDSNGKFSLIPEYTSEHISSILLSARDASGSDDLILNLHNDGFYSLIEKYLKDSVDISDGFFSTALVDYYSFKTSFVNNSVNNIWIDEIEIQSSIAKTFKELELERFESFSDAKSSPVSFLKTSTELLDVIQALGYYCYEEGDYLMLKHRGETIKLKFIVDGLDKGDYYMDIKSRYVPNDLDNLVVAAGIEVSMLYNRNAIVYLKTNKNAYAKNMKDATPNSVSIDGLQVYKEFYSPKYQTQEDKDLPIPDMRKTIYWNPDVEVDSTGRGKVTFYNSDRYTRIKCVLEGITDEGIPVYSECYYDISSSRESHVINGVN